MVDKRHDDQELILTGQRLFGRLLAFELGCPKCDRVYIIGQGSRTMSAWTRRTSRFRCVSSCGLRMNLGILGWNVSLGPGFTPADAVPLHWKQALELRNLARAVYTGEKLAYKGDANRVIAETCSCVRIEFDAECPLHGGLR